MVRDLAGNQSSVSSQVVVRNNTGPQISILSPSSGVVVSGSIIIQPEFDATPDRVRYVDLLMDDAPTPMDTKDLGRQGQTAGTVQFAVDTNSVTIPDGLHRFTVIAYQRQGATRQAVEATIELRVDNAHTDIISPLSGSYLAESSSVVIQALNLPPTVSSVTFQVVRLSGDVLLERTAIPNPPPTPGQTYTDTFTFTIGTTVLPEGPATFKTSMNCEPACSPEDAEASVPVFIDNTLPVIRISSPETD